MSTPPSLAPHGFRHDNAHIDGTHRYCNRGGRRGGRFVGQRKVAVGEMNGGIRWTLAKVLRLECVNDQVAWRERR